MPQCLQVHLPGVLQSVAAATARGGSGRAPAPAAPRRPGPEAAPLTPRLLETRLEEHSRRLEAQRADLEQTCRALGAAVRQLQETWGQLLADAEGQLADLAVEIARKVLGQEIQAGRYEIAPIVAEALRRLPTRRNVVVHLHPADLAQYEAAGCGDGASQAMRLVADPNVRRAECRVETPEALVESVVEGQLAAVAEALKKPE